MIKYSISPKTKILNYIRLIFKFSIFEKILRLFTIGKFEDSFFVKLIPNHYQYSKNTFRKISINGISYFLDINDLVDWYVYYGISEKSIQYLLKAVNKGDVVLDIGSNIGNIAMKIADKITVEGSVHAFEPDNYNYSKFCQNLSLNKFENITLNNFGLGNEIKNVYLKTNDVENRGMNSITDNLDEIDKIQEIKIKTIDYYVSENKLNRINVIKIDVEGYELNVLKGANQTIMKFKPTLFIELDNSNLIRQNQSAIELIKFLEIYNYKIINTTNNTKVSHSDNFDNCHYDIICF